MSALHGGQKIRSSIAAVARWCREWAGSGCEAELQCCGEAGIAGMAKDAGVSVGEFHRLARLGPHASDFLLRRMAALNLDRDEIFRIEPQTFHDLQRVCALCSTQRRCARDLARDAAIPAWKDYCPNAATLTALNALPWVAKR